MSSVLRDRLPVCARTLVLLTTALAWAACEPAAPEAIACNSSADCPGDSVCGGGLCRPSGPALDAGTPAGDATVIDAVILDVDSVDLETRDAAEPDAGSPDATPADAALPDTTLPVAVALSVSPTYHRDDWLEAGQQRRFSSTLVRSDSAVLGDLLLSAPPSWLSASVEALPMSNTGELRLDVDTGALSAGVHSGSVVISSADPLVLPTTVSVRIRVLDWPVLHVGAALEGCPHDDGQGGTDTTCDHWGASGLADALAAIAAPGTRVLLYDDAGAAQIYDGCVEVPGDTWISAAPGVSRDNVLISCRYPDETYPGGNLRLVGHRVHLQDLTVACQEGALIAITAWPVAEQPGAATAGHLLENLVLWAVDPERLGGNSTVQFVELGPDTVLRNSHVLGYFEGNIDLTGAHRSQLLNNSFVLYQQWGSRGFDVRGAQDLVFANNVVLSLSRISPELLTASVFTSGLTVVGNLAEGFDTAVAGLDASDPGNLVADNTVGAENIADLESPLWPRPLADGNQQASARLPGAGRSLDGVVIEGRRDLLPGAYQIRSVLGQPRRTEIRVGTGTCGGQPCDVLASEDNEIQRAVWSVWPGGTVRIYPSSESYAGNAVISWRQDLVGMSALAEPDDVVIQGRDEDGLLKDLNMWYRHRAVLTVIHATLDPVRIANLSLVVDGSSEADARAIYLEGTGSHSPEGLRDLRRLKISAANFASGADPPVQGLYLADRVRVQELLIVGEFGSCLTFGPRSNPTYATPSTTGWVANLSCDLTGVHSRAPRAAFEVASALDTALVNLAVQMAEPAPLLRAQRRSTGDTGTHALDAPSGLRIHSVSHLGASEVCDNFPCGDHTLTAVEEIASGESLFASGTGHHLDRESPALDTGVDPTALNSFFTMGLSLDSVDRGGRALDRGCFEQGN